MLAAKRLYFAILSLVVVLAFSASVLAQPSGFPGKGGSKGKDDPNADSKRQIASDQAQITNNKSRIKLDKQKLEQIADGLSDDDGGPCNCAPGKGSCTADDFKQFGIDATQVPAAQACVSLFQDAGKKLNGISSIPCRNAVSACGDVADDLNKKKLQAEVDDLTSSNDDLSQEIATLKANETDDTSSGGDCANCDAQAAASAGGQGAPGSVMSATPTRGQTINQGLSIVGGMLGNYLNYRSYNNALSTGASEYSECLNNAATIGVPVTQGSCGGSSSGGYGYGYGATGYGTGYGVSGLSSAYTGSYLGGSGYFGTTYGLGTTTGYSPFQTGYNPYLSSGYSPYGASALGSYVGGYAGVSSGYPVGYSSPYVSSPYSALSGGSLYGTGVYGSSVYGSSIYGSSLYGTSASQASLATELLNSNPALAGEQSQDLMTAQQAIYTAQYRASQAYSNSAYTSNYGYTGLGYGTSSLYGTGYGYGTGYTGYGSTGYAGYGTYGTGYGTSGYGYSALGGISVSGALGFGLSY